MINRVNGEAIIYGYYTKYNRLKEIIDIHYDKCEASSINIFIDLYSILKGLFSSRDNICNLIFNDSKFMFTIVLNMCAHYREFFRTRYGITTKIFIINSLYDSYRNTNSLYVKEYTKSFSKSYTGSEIINNYSADDILNMNFGLFRTIIPYIPDIQYIVTYYEMGVRMLEVMEYEFNNNNKNPNLLITKDMYNLQLIGSKYDVKILRPKKYNGSDESYIIDNTNYMYYLYHHRRCKIYPTNISSELISLIYSLNCCPERGIKTLFPINRVINTINTLIANGDILNLYNTDITYISNLISKYITKRNISTLEIENRFKAIDLIYQYSSYIVRKECNFYNGILNLYDPEQIKNLNNTIFKDTPLDIMNL